jgi:hypothetical protein
MASATGVRTDSEPRLEKLETRIAQIEELLEGVGVLLAVVDKARAVRARRITVTDALKIAAVSGVAGVVAWLAVRQRLSESLAESLASTEGGAFS